MRKNILWLVSLSTLVFVLMGCSAAGSLDATSWRLETYVDDTGTMANVLPDSVVTLDFQAEQVSGNASCNNYNGSYQTSGKEIKFGPLATTRKICPEPQGIMDQEYAYLAALDAAAEYNLKGNTLEIEDDQGEVILVFTRATGD